MVEPAKTNQNPFPFSQRTGTTEKSGKPEKNERIRLPSGK
jgi:hypothetical protein